MIFRTFSLIAAFAAMAIGLVYIFTDNPQSTDMIQWGCIFVLFATSAKWEGK